MPPSYTFASLNARRGAKDDPPIVVPPEVLKCFASPALRYIGVAGHATDGGTKDKVVCLMTNDLFVAGPTGTVSKSLRLSEIVDVTRQQSRATPSKEMVVIRYRPVTENSAERMGGTSKVKCVCLEFASPPGFDPLLEVLAFLGPPSAKVAVRSPIEAPIQTSLGKVVPSAVAKAARATSASRQNASTMEAAKMLLREKPAARVRYDAGSDAKTQAFRRRVTRFYEARCPEKAVRKNAIEEALVTFRNDEESLMRALVKKYGPEPPPTPEPAGAADPPLSGSAMTRTPPPAASAHPHHDDVSHRAESPPQQPQGFSHHRALLGQPDDEEVELDHPTSFSGPSLGDVQRPAIDQGAPAAAVPATPLIPSRQPTPLTKLPTPPAAADPLREEGGFGRAAAVASGGTPRLSPPPHVRSPAAVSDGQRTGVDSDDEGSDADGDGLNAAERRANADTADRFEHLIAGTATPPRHSPRANNTANSRGAWSTGKGSSYGHAAAAAHEAAETSRMMADLADLRAEVQALKEKEKLRRVKIVGGGNDGDDDADDASVDTDVADPHMSPERGDGERPQNRPVYDDGDGAGSDEDGRAATSSRRLDVSAALMSVRESFAAAAAELERDPSANQHFVRAFHQLAGPLRALHDAVAPFTAEAEAHPHLGGGGDGGSPDRSTHHDGHHHHGSRARFAPSPDAVSPIRGGPEASAASYHFDAHATAAASEARQRRADVRKSFLPSTWITADLGEVNRNVQPPTTKRYHRVLAERLTADGMLRGGGSETSSSARSAGAPPESELVLATRSQLATGFGGWAIRTSDILTVCPGVVRKLPQFGGSGSRPGAEDSNPLLRGASLSELGGVSPVLDRNSALPFATASQDLSITVATRRHVIVLEFESRPDKDAWLRRLMTLRARNAQSPGWLLGFPEETAPGEAPDLYAPTPRRDEEPPVSVARRRPQQQHSFGSSPGKAAAGGLRQPFLFESPSSAPRRRHDGESPAKSPAPAAFVGSTPASDIRALDDSDAVAVNDVAGGLRGIPSATDHVPATVVRGRSTSSPSVTTSSRRLTVASELDSDEEDVASPGRKVPGTLAAMLAGLGTNSPTAASQQQQQQHRASQQQDATPPLGLESTPPMVSVPPTPVSLRRRQTDIDIDDDDDAMPSSGLFPVRNTPGRGVSPGSILPSALRTPTSVTDAEHSSL